MRHRDALAHPAAEHQPPNCPGELVTPAPAFFGDASWEIYTCAVCAAQVATVGGRVHWWNHELRPVTGAGEEADTRAAPGDRQTGGGGPVGQDGRRDRVLAG